MSKSDYKSVLLKILRIALIALCVGYILFDGIIPGFRNIDTDFPNYYTAAKMFASGEDLSNIYDNRSFQRFADSYGIENTIVSYVPQSPSGMLPYLSVCFLNHHAAKIAWTLFNLIFLLVSVLLLSKIYRVKFIITLMLAGSLVTPIASNFKMGQEYLFLLMLISFWLYFWQKKREIPAGLLLGIATSIKPFPIFLLIPVIASRKWKTFFWMVIGLLLPNVIFAFFSPEIFSSYIKLALPATLSGDIQNPYSLSFRSYTVILRHLFLSDPFRNPEALLFNSPFMFIFLRTTISLLILHFVTFVQFQIIKSKTISEIDGMSICLLGAILISPMISSYQYVLLLPTFLFLARHFAWYQLFTLLNFHVFFVFSVVMAFSFIELMYLLALIPVIYYTVPFLEKMAFRRSLAWILPLIAFSLAAAWIGKDSRANNYYDNAKPVTNVVTSGFMDELQVSGDNIYFTEIRDGNYAINLNNVPLRIDGYDLLKPSIVFTGDSILMSCVACGKKTEKLTLMLEKDKKWDVLWRKTFPGINEIQLLPQYKDPLSGPAILTSSSFNDRYTLLADYPLGLADNQLLVMKDAILFKYVEETQDLYYLSKSDTNAWAITRTSINEKNKPPFNVVETSNPMRDFDISPNGKYIVYTEVLLSGKTQIFMAETSEDRIEKASDSEKKTLLSGPLMPWGLTMGLSRDYSPVFVVDSSSDSPSEYIYFISERGGGLNDGRLYRIEIGKWLANMPQ